MSLKIKKMITKTRHTGLVVKNLNKSIEFYEHLGLKLWKREIETGSFISKVVGLKKVIIETAKLKIPDGSLMELLEYKSHPSIKKIAYYPSNNHGCSHMAFTVDNIEETSKKIFKMGGAVVNEPAISQNGSVKVMYCYDLEGILIELVEEL